MAARIAKGGGAARARPQQRNTRSGGSKRKPKRVGFAEQMGLAPHVVGRVIRWGSIGIAAAVAIAAMSAFQVPQLIGTAMAEGMGEAGLTVHRYEIRGVNRMDRGRVDAVVQNELNKPMALVDIDALRETLLNFGWIGEARVSRRLPDTLVIDVVERTPAAIWQNAQQLMLIDGSGVVLEHVRLDAMPDLPLVIGPAANQQTGSLARLLGAAPHLRPQVSGATWIGARRWDLRFQSGETLALPEGNAEALRAIGDFARRDQQAQMLGRGFVRFDMRIPGRMTVRVSREPGSAVPAIAPPTAPGQSSAPSAPAGSPPADLSNTI